MSYLVPKKILPEVICSLDDFYPDYKANGLDKLFYLKYKYPKFKVTLFTIPERNEDSYTFFDEISKFDWIELAVHGMFHDPINECTTWDGSRAEFVLSAMEQMDCFVKVFKAPGWHYNQATYDQLKKRNWICADLPDNRVNHPEGLKGYFTDHPMCVHGHTWNLNNPKPEYNNGIEQIIDRGVPFDENSKFYFVSEVI